MKRNNFGTHTSFYGRICQRDTKCLLNFILIIFSQISHWNNEGGRRCDEGEWWNSLYQRAMLDFIYPLAEFNKISNKDLVVRWQYRFEHKVVAGFALFGGH